MHHSGLLIVLLFTGITALFAQDTCLAGDCENGYGALKCDCGYLYKGVFQDGEKKSGTLFKEELHYTGAFQQDMPWGSGAVYFADSSSYRGEFQAAAPHGYGRYYLPAGKLYKGMMKDGDFNGFGVLLRDSTNFSTFYAGEFQNDLENGFGMKRSGDTVTFGKFKKGTLKYGWIGVKTGAETMTWIRSGKGFDQEPEFWHEQADDYMWVKFPDEGVDFFVKKGEFVEFSGPEGIIHRLYTDLKTPPQFIPKNR